MDTLPIDIFSEIVLYIRPQESLSALSCTCSWLYQTIRIVAGKNQWSLAQPDRDFFKGSLLTPFQKNCLKELLNSFTTLVPDVDNAKILCKALYSNFLLQGKKVKASCDGFQRDCHNPEISIYLDKTPHGQPSSGFYVIRLSSNPLPVDEYTPLLLLNTHLTDETKAELDELDLPNPVLLCETGHIIPDLNIPRLFITRDTRYSELKKYDSFVCSYSDELWRVSSLLMQFSGTTKKFVFYRTLSMAKCTYTMPFPSKKRCEYLEFAPKRYIPHYYSFTVPRNMTVAEICLLLVGSGMVRDYRAEVWLRSLVGEPKALKIRGGCALAKHFTNEYTPFWLCLDPLEEWNTVLHCKEEDVIPLMAIATGKRFARRPPPPNVRSLREKLQFSLTQTCGVKNTDSLTVNELKDLCRECGLPVSGTRKQLIERLLNEL
jgi:hypothetical protein